MRQDYGLGGGICICKTKNPCLYRYPGTLQSLFRLFKPDAPDAVVHLSSLYLQSAVQAACLHFLTTLFATRPISRVDKGIIRLQLYRFRCLLHLKRRQSPDRIDIEIEIDGMAGFRDPLHKRPKRMGWLRTCFPCVATFTLLSILLSSLGLLAHFRSPARAQQLGWQSWDVVRTGSGDELESGSLSLPLDVWVGRHVLLRG